MKKLFSEFASCWGGAAVIPTAELAGAPRRHAEERRRSKRTAKVSGAAANNWKPKLNAISENSPMSDAAAAAADKRRPVKPKIKSPARAAPPPEDYWYFLLLDFCLFIIINCF